MAVNKFNPTSPSRRGMAVLDFSELTTSKPLKSLTKGKRATGGRNNNGRITTRFRGAGVKRLYRQVDFLRDKIGIPATVVTIEYDPNRTCNIALLNYADGEKRYIIAPNGLKVGDAIMSGATAEIKPGNSLKLKDIPVGIELHNIELVPGHGAKLVRAAGQFAVLRGKDNGYAQIKLPSGEVRLIHLECSATVGQVGNLDHMKVKLGKAGKKRYMGKRPHVRGVVMN
ncbi:MAG: 50S ribosomal protein L2, partial [Victivallaceae bacterium]